MERRAGVDGTSARKTGTLNSSSDSNKVNCSPYFFRPIARGEYKNVGILSSYYKNGSRTFTKIFR